MRDYGDVPHNLEMVNLGSTFAKYGFDYCYFGKRGFNFASAPQTLKTDLAVLQNYSGHIKKGAIVFVAVVCPFEFCVYDYAKMPAKEPFCKSVVRLVKKIVKKNIFYDYWNNRKPAILSPEEQSKQNVRSRVESWKNEFALQNTSTQKPTQKLKETFEKTQMELKRILSLCKEKELQPILVSMPMVAEESSCFSDAFLQSFYKDNLQVAIAEGVPVIDYFRDKRFDDASLYENYADCLNDKGRHLLAEILIEDLSKLGFWENKHASREPQ